jgi:foldase protein PrsA
MKQLIAGVAAGAAVVGGIWFFTGAADGSAVAKVGGEQITTKEFHDKLEKTSGKDVLKRMIDDQVIMNQAKELKLEATDKEVQDEIDAMVKERFEGDNAKFEEALKQYNLTKEDLFQDYKVNVTAQKIATKDVQISEAEIKDHYDKNKETLGTPEQLKARHILVKDEAKAKELYDKLKADPNQFEALAKENSEDPGSKEKGGMLEPFGKGAMVPEFETAAFAAKVNEINAPVKSEFGYHIIQVLEHTEAKIPPLEEVKAKIEKTLKTQKAPQFADLINQLRAKEAITINHPNFKDILNAPTPEAPAAGGTTTPPAGQ